MIFKGIIRNPSSIFGYFWYSKRQEQVDHSQGDFSRTYCSVHGKTRIYTEWKDGHPLYDPSNWPDAICLGHGYFKNVLREDPFPICQSERREALSLQLCQCQQCGFSFNTDEFELYISGKFAGFTCPHCDSNELKILK